MSGADSSQGPGWWQASDNKWYPPEQKPGAAPTTPTPTPTATPTPAPAATPSTAPSTPSPSAIPSASPVSGSESGEGGFFSRLFDMSFSRFVTPSLITVLFILAIILISLSSVIMLIVGAARFSDGGFLLVILAPIYWLLGIIYVRVLLELAVVFFRIEINTRPKT